MLNLAQFDKNLIELPPESPQVGGGLPSENRPKVNNGIQYKADGTHTMSLRYCYC